MILLNINYYLILNGYKIKSQIARLFRYSFKQRRGLIFLTESFAKSKVIVSRQGIQCREQESSLPTFHAVFFQFCSLVDSAECPFNGHGSTDFLSRRIC
jgi:hypothetical protein